MKAQRFFTLFKLVLALALLSAATTRAAYVTSIGQGSHANDTLYVMSDGSLWGMGYDSDGELGDGQFYTSNPYGVDRPEEIVSNGVVAVALGANFTIFVKTNGSLWGMGILSDGSHDRPVQIVASNVTAVAADYSEGYFTKSDGSLWDFYEGAAPVEVVSSNVTAISELGYYIRSDSTLWEIGNSSASASNVVAVSAGNDGVYYIKSDSTLWLLGDSSATANNVVAVSSGWEHYLFIKSDGTLWGMGDNSKGELGDGTFVNPSQPEQITSGVVAIAAEGGHSAFLTVYHDFYLMGDDWAGQLGDGQYTPTSSPPGVDQQELLVGGGAVSLGIGTYGSPAQHVIFFPQGNLGGRLLQMTTNLSSTNWVTISNAVPFSGYLVTNAPGPAFFRMQ